MPRLELTRNHTIEEVEKLTQMSHLKLDMTDVLPDIKASLVDIKAQIIDR